MLMNWYGSPTVAIAVLAILSPSRAGPTRREDDYNAESQVLTSPYPFNFPVLQEGAASNSGQFPMPLCHGFKLEEATIDQLQDAMQDGKLSSKKLVECYLQRIYQVDFYIR
jgi:hypothetical protein